MKDRVILIAETLLAKHIPFCLYRFPDEERYNLALEREMLPHQPNKTLWIAPFTGQSDAEEIYFSVVEPDLLPESAVDSFAALPQRTMKPATLPAEESQNVYFERIGNYLRDIGSGKLQKSVLSRVIHVDKPDGFDPLETFHRLSADYPDAFVHLLSHPDAGMWMGATPELLLKKRDNRLVTMALAGTQPGNPSGKYAWRPKEVEEHKLLWDHIENAFVENNCTMLLREGPYTVRAASVAHLRTDYIFTQNGDLNLRQLLKTLHPTPAIGGVPVDKAIGCISQYEGYDRKYYGGFIGQTDFSKTADFYVNLRCMQISDKKIALYVGGGITADSDPQEEWEETINKSKTLAEKIQPEVT